MLIDGRKNEWIPNFQSILPEDTFLGEFHLCSSGFFQTVIICKLHSRHHFGSFCPQYPEQNGVEKGFEMSHLQVVSGKRLSRT